MTYDIYFEMLDGHCIKSEHAARMQSPAEVEHEITNGDDYVVSNSKKHVRVKRANVSALIIELKEE